MSEYYVCTGCALLCDDIEVEIENSKIKTVHAACRKGVARMKGCSDPLECTVDGEKTDVDSAITKAAEILREAENPLIFGHGNSSSEAQKLSIGLAKKTGAYLDDTSSFCQGPVIEAILQEKLRTCTLDDIRHKADVIIFWGADPSNSHPRHLSRYSYFPRGKERQRGWEEDRTAICVDVRKSETAVICGANRFYQIPMGGDEEFMDALVSALSSKVPKTSFGFDAKRILELANVLKKAKFGVICVGLGLIYSLEDLEPLFRLIDKLNEVSEFSLMPMVGQYNMRGFNQNLYEETGFINRVKFNSETGEAKHGPEFSVVESLREKSVDAALIIGSDPLSSLPLSVSRYLADIPLITIDPCRNLTSSKAEVTIPCAFGGVEYGGTAVRMDGVEVKLKKILDTENLPDAEILRKITEAI
ncbi:formylmethanofuran dehydrogenase, subunit B [Methanolobus tindarius DSM 2278]|uniref:Formylmethanofuran dehydrogenase, subunit B n=1 Tax=Methanolobus tindarius DSM 2278 TaxID=1090322 RepID=W9DP14_METTI|nr:formylmethanofuran dehydrogenase subunit B [Methanolobus tindarius]ETA66775.1 formylmethanofuran dehydrogenase, subunit B [Methanolobus tindarius DSM 2278]